MVHARGLTIAALCIGLLGAMLPARADGPKAQRMYLMSNDSDYLYWSVDPGDPELPMMRITRTCGTVAFSSSGNAKPCPSYMATPPNNYGLSFSPATLFREPVEWTAAEPLRFHLALTVQSMAPYTVHMIVHQEGASFESAAATELTAGVWEGSLSKPGTLDPGKAAYLTLMVRAQGRQANARLTLGVGGASYVELPSPVEAASVPRLLSDDTYHPDPNTLGTAERRFVFNDREWSITSYDGNLSDASTFSITLDRDAEAVLGWVESFSRPWLHGVLRGDLDTPTPLEQAFVTLSLDDAELVSYERRTATAMSVVPGTLSLKVEPYEYAQPYPYRAHLLVIYGERTLSTMRWAFPLNGAAFRAPFSAGCPGEFDDVPVPAEATTLSLDLSWDTPDPQHQKWTLSYGMEGIVGASCGNAGTGTHVRLTSPRAARTAGVSFGPAYDTTNVSVWDVVFQAQVHYTYTRRPEPEAE